MRENQALRERLSRLSEASLRINESLDPDTVLQEVMDNARTLTGARFGSITTLDDGGGCWTSSPPACLPKSARRCWR